ncbi:unnamed protein product [Choristocarpus tenellus]
MEVDGDLLNDLLVQLQLRNNVETEPFRDVYGAHKGILKQSEAFRQQTVAQDKEIIILRHKLTEGMSRGESSDALRNMQEELQRLQSQVTDKYRSQAEATSEQLRLMKKVQILQGDLKRTRHSLEKLQVEHGDSMSRCRKLEQREEEQETALNFQRKEVESLRGLLEGREAEAMRMVETLRKEREELVARLLKDKER